MVTAENDGEMNFLTVLRSRAKILGRCLWQSVQVQLDRPARQLCSHCQTDFPIRSQRDNTFAKKSCHHEGPTGGPQDLGVWFFYATRNLIRLL
jgi:hypothetical protein